MEDVTPPAWIMTASAIFSQGLRAQYSINAFITAESDGVSSSPFDPFQAELSRTGDGPSRFKSGLVFSQTKPVPVRLVGTNWWGLADGD